MRGLIYALQGLQLKGQRIGGVRQLGAQEALEFRDVHWGFGRLLCRKELICMALQVKSRCA